MMMKLTPYTFTLLNTCNTETAYVINLETVSSGEEILADNYVKANLIKATEEVFIDKLIESHENLDKVIEDASAAYKLDQGTLKGKESVSYSLRLWMDEDTPALDEVMDASWQGKITITASYVPKNEENDKELYNIVKKQASLDNVASEFVTSETGIDFGVAPSDTNGKGVYTIAATKDYEYPVYYFRGEVTNNNVKFANFCWKIVRTTETGGVKLIYSGLPDENGGCTNTTGEGTQIGTSAFNETSNSTDYVGYMYSETNENNSTIKTVIDTWYQNNMLDYTKYLEDTVWCHDRSDYEAKYYGVTRRNENLNQGDDFIFKPSIECSNNSDKFIVSSERGNGKLTYPVALLTADEVTFAGSGFSGYSENNYLITSQPWWSLSPSGFISYCAFGFTVFENLGNSRVHITIGVRPSVSLTPGTMINAGDGTTNSSYEILLNSE